MTSADVTMIPTNGFIGSVVRLSIPSRRNDLFLVSLDVSCIHQIVLLWGLNVRIFSIISVQLLSLLWLGYEFRLLGRPIVGMAPQ
jgi:hypothetical protein